MEDSLAYNNQFIDSQSGYSLVIDDDGRVVYAYLLNMAGEVTSDVWLYNHCKTPIEPEWKNFEKAPFANSAEYAKDITNFNYVEQFSNIKISWNTRKDQLVEVKIFINEKCFAYLIEKLKPSYCSMAKKDGPLARVLIDEHY